MDALGKGLQQRIRALNLFIQDIYNDQSHKGNYPKRINFICASYLNTRFTLQKTFGVTLLVLT
jgi:uncharacterized circularly permuted ATP-grasp superfamily protein